VSVDSVAYSGTDGILTDNGDGTHSFAPNENFNGDVSLDVTVVDDDGATDVTTAGIDVIAVNDTPVVSGDLAYSVDEDGSITFSQEQLLANASDVDGDSLSATNLSAGGDSTVTDNGDGTFTVTPDAEFNGDIQLSFDVSDGIETVAAGVGLTVNSINDGPIALDDTAITDEDSSVLINVLANDSDLEGSISIDSVTSPVILNGVEVGTAEIVDAPVIVHSELSASDATSVSNVNGGLQQDGSYSSDAPLEINGTSYDNAIGMFPNSGRAEATFDIPDGATSFSSTLGMLGSGQVDIRVYVDNQEMFYLDQMHSGNDGVVVDFDFESGSQWWKCK